MIRINFLPPRGKLVTFLKWSFVSYFCLSLLFMLLLNQGQSSLSAKIRQLERKITLVNDDQLTQDTSEMATEVFRLESDITQLDQKMDQLSKGKEPSMLILMDIVKMMPENIYLRKIQWTGTGNLHIEGESISYKLVLEWMEVLQLAIEFKRIQLLDFAGDAPVSFTMGLEMGGGKE